MLPSTTVSEPAYLPSMATLNYNLGALPLQGGNKIDLIPGYHDSIAAMTAEVAAARSTVEVEFYITAWDDVTGPFFEALVAAAARGVQVRLLVDHLGSRGIPGYDEFVKRLDASDIEWRPMLPLRPLKGEFRRPDLRNHRKILVVDGTSGLHGVAEPHRAGLQQAEEPQAAGREWVELVARIDGPTVSALRAVFAKDWFTETHERLAEQVSASKPQTHAGGVAAQVLPSGPGYVTENNLRLFTALIYSAQSRVSLTSPTSSRTSRCCTP